MISPLKTDRLLLIPAEIRHLEAEVERTASLSAILGVEVPDNWPPEILRDALPYFLKQLREQPSSVGWNGWYWIRRATANEPAVLIGDGGFVAPPDDDGEVEIGYSVLPQFQGLGYASEGALALIDWAFGHPEITRIIGETDHDNSASIRVLQKLGFTYAGPGSEAGRNKWQIMRREFANQL